MGTSEEQEGVFEYETKPAQLEDEDEVELDIEREDLEDDNTELDEPFEYSAENLGEFVNELKNQQDNPLAQTEKSEEIITKFLSNVSSSKNPRHSIVQ